MFSNSPDSAARSLMYQAVFWLLVGVSAFTLASMKLVAPDLLATKLLSYSRLRATASLSLTYGWLTLAGLAAAFYVVPRVVGARVGSEKAGQAAGLLISIGLLLAVSVSMFGGVKGPAFLELPAYVGAVYVLALVLAASSLIRGVARRTEERLYVSVFFFLGAVIWLPLSLAVGVLHGLDGVADAVAGVFGVGSTLTLWLAAVLLGTFYYVLPRVTGGTLWSHGLALAGFWTLAVAGPLSAPSLLVFGPAPDWWESVGIAGSIVMLIPVLTVVVNLFGTLSSAPSRGNEQPSLRFVVGGAVFWALGTLFLTLLSLRSINRAIGLTGVHTGLIWAMLIGAFSLAATGLIVYAFPKVMGRRWVSQGRLQGAFWLMALGGIAIALAAFGTGLGTAAVWVAGTAAQQPLSSGTAFDVVLNVVAPFRALGALGALGAAVGAWLFVIDMFRSTASGDPHPVEIVTVAEVL